MRAYMQAAGRGSSGAAGLVQLRSLLRFIGGLWQGRLQGVAVRSEPVSGPRSSS
jgi:hypothetical protein